MFHEGSGIVIRVVIIRLALDKLLGLFSSSLVIFRFQSCSHGFQCRFARHYSRCAETAGRICRGGAKRSASSRYVTSYRYQRWTQVIFELAMSSLLGWTSGLTDKRRNHFEDITEDVLNTT